MYAVRQSHESPIVSIRVSVCSVSCSIYSSWASRGRGRRVKALTVCQPYAELIARGEKLIENRTWPTSYRGLLFIHAGKSREWMEPEDDEQYPGMAFGALVATARLVDCVRVERLPEVLTDNPHANGPWCWILTDVNRITPITFRGAQGLWDVPASVALTALPAKDLTP